MTSYTTQTIAYTPTTPPVDPTPIDEDSTHEIDKENDFGDVLTTNITTATGNTTSTSVGKVWTIKISIPNALNIGLTFGPLSIPSNAEMYLFNGSETILVDSITKSAFKDSSCVAIPSMPGNSIIVYIVEKGNTGALKTQVHIVNVVAGYGATLNFSTSSPELEAKGQPTTLSNPSALSSFGCAPSVICSSKITQAKGVCYFASNGKSGTGTLLNNGNNNGRAYLLTAFHVLDKNKNKVLDAGEIAALSDSYTIFKYWSTNSCTGGGTLNPNQILIDGATLAASNYYTDCVLLELREGPGIGDDVTYNAWNRSATPNNSGSYILHHPLNSDMRICTSSNVKNWVWNDHFWSMHYADGSTDHGSSGGPLFNQLDQVSGQLRGGWSACSNGFGDRYGKLGDSWSVLQPSLSPSSPNLDFLGALYTNTQSINGPGTIYCGTSVQYSVNNFYGCSFTWSVGANLSITSGQGTATITVTATTGNINSAVNITIRSPKGYNKTLSLTKGITLSTAGPAAATINSVNVQPSPGTQISVNFTLPSNTSNIASYKFYVDNVAVKSGTGLPVSPTTLNGGGCNSHIVYLQLINTCGSTNSNNYPYNRPCSQTGFIVYPNPSNTVVTVSTSEASEAATGIKPAAINAAPPTTSVSETKKQVTVRNSMGQLVLKPQSFQGKTALINISSLAAGTFWITINDGKSAETHPLIVQH